MDLSDMAASGGNRSFSIEGDVGAIFSLEITNEDSPPAYYNFSTGLFSTTKSRLKQKVIGSSGRFDGDITFPSVTDNDQYDIYLWAESAHDTVHVSGEGVRFGDGTIDINSSTGSNSNLLQKVIYQYTDTTISLTADFETGAVGALADSDAGWLDTDVDATMVIGRGKNSVKQPFTMTLLSPAAKAMRILRQPVANDFYFSRVVQLSGTELIQGENIWAEAAGRSSGTTDGQTRGTSALNIGGGVSGATKLIVDALPTGTLVGDRLTGFNVSGNQNCLNAGTNRDTTIVLITALNPDGDNANEFTVDTAVSIADDHVLYFNAPYYHRFKTNTAHADGDVRGLSANLRESRNLDEINPTVTAANGGNMPNVLAPYEDSTTYTVEISNEDGSVSEQTFKNINRSYPAIDITGFNPTVVNGQITKQDGIITYESPQKANISYTTFYPRGTEAIQSYFNTEIRFTDLKVELTAPTTTTTSRVSNSTSVPVADREGVIHSVSTISGIGIDPSAANPTVASGGEADGAGTWVLSAAQTIESGTTLTVNGTSRNATITGNIEVISCGSSNFTLALDVEGFITGT